MSLWGLIYGQYITKLEIKRFEKSSKRKLPIQMVEREWWGTGYRIIDSYLEVNLSQFYCLIYGFN